MELAQETGLEPVTRRLTAGCSTIELLWNPKGRAIYRRGSGPSIGFSDPGFSRAHFEHYHQQPAIRRNRSHAKYPGHLPLRGCGPRTSRAPVALSRCVRFSPACSLRSLSALTIRAVKCAAGSLDYSPDCRPADHARLAFAIIYLQTLFVVGLRVLGLTEIKKSISIFVSIVI